MSGSLGQTYPINTGVSEWQVLDIKDMILDQDPRDTPFFEMTGEAVATNTRHYWPVRGVKARGILTNVEGNTLTGQEIARPTMEDNYTQIQMTGVTVTGTVMEVSYYGAPNMWEDQVQLRTYEHRADTERSLIRASQAAGATNTARQMGGLLDSSNVCVNLSTDMAGASFTETRFINMIADLWGQTNRSNFVCLVNATAKKLIDQFDSRSTRQFEVTNADRGVVHEVRRYSSSFGDIDIHLSRDMPETASDFDIVAFEASMMKKAWLRNRTPKLIPVAKTADADTAVILDEITLEYGDPDTIVYQQNYDAV